MLDGTVHPYTASLLRQFTADADDGSSRLDRERRFMGSVALLDPIVRAVLAELDHELLAHTGTVDGGDVVRLPDQGLQARWTLSWPQGRAAGAPPVAVLAVFASTARHPELRGGTVGAWPLNDVSRDDARAELPTLRAIAAAEIYELVQASGDRIIPAASPGRPPR